MSAHFISEPGPGNPPLRRLKYEFNNARQLSIVDLDLGKVLKTVFLKDASANRARSILWRMQPDMVMRDVIITLGTGEEILCNNIKYDEVGAFIGAVLGTHPDVRRRSRLHPAPGADEPA